MAFLPALPARLRDDERGITLIVALGVLVVLSILITTAVDYSSANARSASVSDKENTSYALAEAGVNNAMSILANPTNNALDKYLLCPVSAVTPTLPCTRTDSYTTGTATWSGTLNQNVATGAVYWTITSSGYVQNPSGGGTAAQLQRRIVATISVLPTLSQPLNNPSWNYIFVRAPNWSGQALNGCDMSLLQGVNVTANLYVLGNLCLANQAKITGGKLYVKGSVDQQSSHNTIGVNGGPLAEAHVALGCQYLSQALHNPCLQGAGGSSGFDNIWATVLDNSVQVITPPTVDWNGWYLNASPGPYYPCNAQQAGDPPLPSFSFDTPVAAMTDTDANKLAYKNDNQGVVNLAPIGLPYKCKTASGELSWDGTSTLTTSGTIFIDGSAVVQNGATNLYKGAGVIYLSGSFLLKNSKLCAYSSGTTCTTANWNNQQDLLGIVANGNGSVPADSQVSAGDSIQLVSAYMMGALYATNAIDIGTTSTFDGPMDGASILLGQASTSTFSGFTYVPVALPGENTVYAQPQAPTFTGG
jgi:Tfp pilus assembly protein PilX